MRRLSNFLGSGRQGVRTLGSSDRVAAMRWLAARPASAAFVLGWLHRYGMPTRRRQSFFELYVRGADDDWNMMALVVDGALVSFVDSDVEGAYALASHMRSRGMKTQTLVGPDGVTYAFRDGYLPHGELPRVDQRQCLMIRHIRDDGLTIMEPALPVVRARPMDIPRVVQASLRMHQEEVRRPNSRGDVAALRRSATQKVRAQRVWIVKDPYRGLVFKASISLPSPEVVQVEGVWTAPAVRGQGIARRSLIQICRELHEQVDAISLTVGRANHGALRLYEGLGFVRVRDWRTMYLDADNS